MQLVASAGIAQTLNINPVWLAMASLSGGISIGHINDSGFWVVTNLGHLTVSGGLKAYTTTIFFVSILAFIFSLICAMVIPT